MSSTPPEPPAKVQRASTAAEEQPTDEAAAGSATTPAEQPRGTRRHRRAVAPGRGPDPVWHRSAWEDDPRAWGEREESESDSDQRILREKPPHW